MVHLFILELNFAPYLIIFLSCLLLPLGQGPFPGVIDIFGGIGGLTEFRASLLASSGFAVLALAYFAYEDLPAFLGEVDLEYFEEAAEFLLQHPKVPIYRSVVVRGVHECERGVQGAHQVTCTEGADAHRDQNG